MAAQAPQEPSLQKILLQEKEEQDFVLTETVLLHSRPVTPNQDDTDVSVGVPSISILDTSNATTASMQLFPRESGGYVDQGSVEQPRLVMKRLNLEAFRRPLAPSPEKSFAASVLQRSNRISSVSISTVGDESAQFPIVDEDNPFLEDGRQDSILPPDNTEEMEMESADEGSVEVDSADEEGVEMQVETQETAYFSAEEAHSDHFHTPNDAAPNEHGYDSPREEPQPQQKVTKVARPKKPPRLSRHGLPVPGVPRAYLKQLSSKFLNGRVGKPVLDAIEDATFSFLEQMSGDMAAYALHAKRKTIDMEDGILLMKRQRLITDEHSLALLARDMLPRELSDELVPMARPGNDVSGYWAD